jgi:hypothetical protein
MKKQILVLALLSLCWSAWCQGDINVTIQMSGTCQLYDPGVGIGDFALYCQDPYGQQARITEDVDGATGFAVYQLTYLDGRGNIQSQVDLPDNATAISFTLASDQLNGFSGSDFHANAIPVSSLAPGVNYLNFDSSGNFLNTNAPVPEPSTNQVFLLGGLSLLLIQTAIQSPFTLKTIPARLTCLRRFFPASRLGS